MVVVGGVVVFLMRRADKAAPVAVAKAPEAAPVAAAPAPKQPEVVELKLNDKAVGELKYLPKSVDIANRDRNPVLDGLNFKEGGKRLGRVRQILDKSKLGDFMAPKISPDGLQLMLTRPGYNGVYVMPMRGGTPKLVVSANAWTAKWTPEGNIELREEDTIKTYSVDGTLLSTVKHDPSADPIYFENDTIYARSQPGAAGTPLTGSEDRYFNPVASPDGKKIVYSGLVSGLYVANADGSGKPVYLGPGNSPQWTPDGGLLFEHARDDGHVVVESDVIAMDASLGERSNLTEGSDAVSRQPSIGPDGRTVAYDAEDGIFVGTIQ